MEGGYSAIVFMSSLKMQYKNKHRSACHDSYPWLKHAHQSKNMKIMSPMLHLHLNPHIHNIANHKTK